VGQVLVFLVLGTVVYAIIESGRLGWTSPVILGLLVVAVLALVGLIAYEPRRVDPLLELGLFRSVPFVSALVIAIAALCGFGSFLFLTTQYLQEIRGMTPVQAGLSLLPTGVMIMMVSPISGRIVASRGPRLPLLVSGVALALAGLASLWLTPSTPLAAVLAIYLLFGVALAASAAPITNTAVSGMPRSMAGVAASVASSGRQTGTTLGVAIAGATVSSAVGLGGSTFTTAEHPVWWLYGALGGAVVILGLLSTGQWALKTAARAVELFERVDRGREHRVQVAER
jgi:predicted MFS family arabinose efflux permease